MSVDRIEIRSVRADSGDRPPAGLEEHHQPRPGLRGAGRRRISADRRARQRRHAGDGRGPAASWASRSMRDWRRETLRVHGCGGRLPAQQADLFVANCGTTMRFLTATVALGRGTYRLDGTAADARAADRRPARRPGAAAASTPTSEAGNGCPPVVDPRRRPDGRHRRPCAATSPASSSAAC